MHSGTVVQKRTSDPNRRPQPTGVSQHCPESKRSLEPLSRKETQAQFAVKNRITVLNSSPKQNRSVDTQKVTSKNSCCRFLHWSSRLTSTELTINRNPKAKFEFFGGCCNRCYITHWRRLLNILCHVRMFPCPKIYITQPVCRRVTLNRRFRRHESRFLILRIYTPNLRLITLSRLRLIAKVEMKISKADRTILQFNNII